jgi:hypothetical protein
MTMNWLRPVMGLAAQPASVARTANADKHLKKLRMLKILRRAGATGCNGVFLAPAFCGTLPRTMSKSPRQDPGFRAPPIWIHVSEALFSPREAKKRAVIRLIDRMKIGVVKTAKPKI